MSPQQQQATANLKRALSAFLAAHDRGGDSWEAGSPGGERDTPGSRAAAPPNTGQEAPHNRAQRAMGKPPEVQAALSKAEQLLRDLDRLRPSGDTPGRRVARGAGLTPAEMRSAMGLPS
jgi:hypothetical protein